MTESIRPDRLRILVVDDNSTVRAAICSALASAGHETVAAGNGEAALRRFAAYSPDLILLDLNMPKMDGLAVARILRERLGEDWIPIIFLSGETDADAIVEAIEAGGDDYLTKPVVREVLVAKIYALQRIAGMRKELMRVKSELQQANVKLKRLALVDGLTGVANRRYFDDYLRREWNRQLRVQRPLALVLIDVDHFKLYNDRYGHRRGDACLQRIAALLRDQLQRTSDLVARYGGEEFAVVLSEFDRNKAQHFAESLRLRVEQVAIEHDSAAAHSRVTISLGVAALIPDSRRRATDLIDAADRALYQAKDAGRNAVVVSSFSDRDDGGDSSDSGNG